MLISTDQVAGLKIVCPSPEYFEEGQRPFILLREHLLPSGTSPERCDLILCPLDRDGYSSRLFFSERVTRSATATTKDPLNWNGTVRLLERNWFAYSWRIADG